MKNSKVYHSNHREHHHHNIYDKVKKLIKAVNLSDIIKKDDIVAIKIHFGEYGNTAYIRPPIVRIFVDAIIEAGGKPFLTDGSTLYKGSRCDAVSHLNTAVKNGFSYSVVNAPLMIADGLKGSSCIKVKIDGKYFEYVELGAETHHADALLILTHFKLHELAAIGGSIKNISMGLAAKSGKLAMHSSVSPEVNGNKCVKCLRCHQICAANAILKKDKSVAIDKNKCAGCAQCIMNCPVGAIDVVWNAASNITQEKMCEYAKGILQSKENKFCCFNFLNRITPECDCYGHSDASITQDIGILASQDIVAIDKASVDLLNAQEGLKNSALKSNFEPGEDKVKGVYPHLDWKPQIEYAEKIGLGNSNYQLVKV